MRKLTRLTNVFSKKWHNLKAAYAIQFAYYNFCRVHQTLRVTPAMEAGITDRIWTSRNQSLLTKALIVYELPRNASDEDSIDFDESICHTICNQ